MTTFQTVTAESLSLRSTVYPRMKALSLAACAVFAASSMHAQMSMGGDGATKPLLSPPATANVTLAGQTISLKYNAPSLRKRALTSIVPYNEVWRTGANPATTLVTPVSLHVGTLLVPAGTYTVYTLPSREKWMLIINKQTGQWGTVYNQAQDLGRTEMKAHTLPSSQEVMSLSFEDIKKDSAELHVRWGTMDESVKVSTP